MKEEFIKINNNINYEVSNFGNVRSNLFVHKNGTYKILKQNKFGRYAHVNLQGKCYLVHRLVAEAFILNPDSKPCINHIDNNKLNNIASNLEWVTNKENSEHVVKQERTARGSRVGTSKLTESQVLYILSSNLKQVDLGIMFNVSQTAISSIQLGKNWKYIKYENN